MKYFFLIATVLLILTSCRDEIEFPCVGPDCPLSTGEECPGNLSNIEDQCVCSETAIMLNDSLCVSGNDTTLTRFYAPINCECIDGDIIIGFSEYVQFAGIYSLNSAFSPQQGVRIGGPIQFLGNATIDDFNGLLYPAQCQGNGLYLHGSLSGDTLNFELFFINSSSLDTCGPFQAFAF